MFPPWLCVKVVQHDVPISPLPPPPLEKKKKKQFPSSRNSDQHQFSPNNLELYSGEKVMRVNNLIGGT